MRVDKTSRNGSKNLQRCNFGVPSTRGALLRTKYLYERQRRRRKKHVQQTTSVARKERRRQLSVRTKGGRQRNHIAHKEHIATYNTKTCAHKSAQPKAPRKPGQAFEGLALANIKKTTPPLAPETQTRTYTYLSSLVKHQVNKIHKKSVFYRNSNPIEYRIFV